MSNKSLTFYTGITNNLQRRIFEHKNYLVLKSFTSRYHITKLVYFEFYETAQESIQREKHIKRQSRAEKIELIKLQNPQFQDLYDTLEDILS